MASIRIELLGTLRISCNESAVTSVNTNRLQSLLAFLVLHSDAVQSREHLAFLLWPESGESQARTNLRQLIHNLRRALPAECDLLVTDNQSIRWLKHKDCTIDVLEFEAAVARAAEAAKRADRIAERHDLEEAAKLYQDDLLRGVYDDWLQPRRESLSKQLSSVLSRLTVLLEELGDYPEAIRHAERLVAQDPLPEANYRLLIRLHVRNGDRASALRAYHQCMRVLRRELGVSPGPATRELFDQVLKSEPIADPHTESPPAVEALTLPMVGRSEEWERLQECWRLATQSPTNLALILGEPGIGKTRLAEELYTWCSQHHGSVARARCYAAQGQLAYAPIAEWLRAAPLRNARLELPVRQLSELARILPEILEGNQQIPPPQPFTESWQRRHLYEALTAVFGKAEKPLLLLIDDLQWCDQDSFEWLHSLFRSESGNRILVLATARPEETGRDHPLSGLRRELAQRDQVSEFSIQPLDGEQTALLATQIGNRQFDAADLSHLYKATGGNPLFVVESVRARLGSPQTETQSLGPIETLPRIHAVINARLAQLTPAAYELAGLASAIGTSFSFDLLAKATDWDEASLLRTLEELWNRRIIGGHDDGEYDFTHDRLREVASQELNPVRRRFLHRRIARALEEVHASDLDAVSGQLAAHYEAAGMAEQAIHHYLDAARVAKGRFADSEAAGLLRRALTRCRELPETPKRDEQELSLLVALGPSLVTTQGYGMPEVGETYERALSLSRRLGEGQYRAFMLGGAWLFHIVRGELEKSRELGQQLIALAGAEAPPSVSIAAHFVSGCSLFHLGEIENARTHIQHALSSDPAPTHPAILLFGGPDLQVFCRSYLSHVLWFQGYPDQALAKSREAMEAAEGHPFSMALSLDYAAMMHLYRRESKLVLRRAEEAIGVCRKYGFAYYLAWAELLKGWAMAAEGEPVSGLAQMRQGLEALRATAAELRLPFYYGLLAEVHEMCGQTGEALANIAAAFAFQMKNGESWAVPDLHRIHGDLLLRSGKSPQAQASYQRALESAQHLGAKILELRAAARLCGLPGQGPDILQDVYQNMKEGLDTPDLLDARAQLQLAAAKTGGGA
jgi:DNA-binding SARP family transcriptional activator/predicted ATPase